MEDLSIGSGHNQSKEGRVAYLSGAKDDEEPKPKLDENGKRKRKRKTFEMNEREFKEKIIEVLPGFGICLYYRELFYFGIPTSNAHSQ